MSNELYHYGVLGMKWGAHKARQYAADKNAYVRKQRDSAAKQKLKSGEYTTNQYRSALKRNRRNEFRKNQKVVGDTLKLSPKKGAKISSIYSKYKKQAIKTIPNYKLKKGAKTAASILFNIGTSGISMHPSVAAGRLIVKPVIQYGAKQLAIQATKTTASTVGRHVAEDYIYKRTHKGGGK